MFIEERLLECVTFGTRGGPTWLTRKVTLNSGVVRRNAMRSRPLYRYGIIYRNLEPDQHRAVIDAFNACRGGLYGFRLKDWQDFEVEDQILPAAGTGSEQTAQLIKTYGFGGQSTVRDIRKPVQGTVTLTANGSPLSPTSIDYTTGVVTYTASNGSVVRWSGEFDVPVMFEDDELSFAASDRGARGLFLTADVSLIEDISA